MLSSISLSLQAAAILIRVLLSLYMCFAIVNYIKQEELGSMILHPRLRVNIINGTNLGNTIIQLFEGASDPLKNGCCSNTLIVLGLPTLHLLLKVTSQFRPKTERKTLQQKQQDPVMQGFELSGLPFLWHLCSATRVTHSSNTRVVTEVLNTRTTN